MTRRFGNHVGRGGPAAAPRPAALLLAGGFLVATAAVVVVLLTTTQVRTARAQPAAEVAGTSEVRMRETVRNLCARDKDGRGPGSNGLLLARDYIAESFRRVSVAPAGEKGTLFQIFTPTGAQTHGTFRLPEGQAWGKIELANIVGVLPSETKDAPCILICAHYDHLGESGTQEIYPGADDNASGVAVLLELASQMRWEGPFRNTVIFAAFSGEEEGTLGAHHYLARPLCPVERTLAVLNLDTVGRMEGKKLFVFGTGTAAEFPEIVKGANQALGLELATPDAAPFSSDQAPFCEKGIPALHLFTGPNADYHQTTDTPDKLNYPGMVAVLDFARETAISLAGREERLSFVRPGAGKVTPVSRSR